MMKLGRYMAKVVRIKIGGLGGLACALALMMNACTFGSEPEKNTKDMDVTLRVAHFRASQFHERYDRLIELHYPNLRVDVIDTDYLTVYRDGGDWEEWINTHKPDLFVAFHPDLYYSLAEEGLFQSLDAFIQSSGFDLEAFSPAVIELLKRNSNGQLYGLTPNFNNWALFYNTEHFDRLGISYPSDKMNWVEVLQLARHFQFDQTGVYGYRSHNRSPFEWILEIGKTEDLNYYNPITNDFYFATDAWWTIWQEVLLTYEANAVLEIEPGKIGAPFPENVAMYIGDSNEFGKMTMSPSQYADWKIISYPVSHSQPDRTHNLYLYYPISILERSELKEEAWELLQFLMSDDVARYENGSFDRRGLQSRVKWNTVTSIEGAEVLWNALPKLDQPASPDDDQLNRIISLGNRYFAQVRAGELTLDDALRQLSEDSKRIVSASE